MTIYIKLTDPDGKCMQWLNQYLPNGHSDGTACLDVGWNFIAQHYWTQIKGLADNFATFYKQLYPLYMGPLEAHKKGIELLSEQRFKEIRLIDGGAQIFFMVAQVTIN